MRTTVDIPDHLMRRAKSVAALEGKSIKEFVIEALESRLQLPTGRSVQRRRVRLPLVRSRTPGALRFTADDLAAALVAEEIHALARR